MIKTQNVTLAVTIKEKKIVGDDYDKRYSVNIKRADRREMELFVDYDVYEGCIVGKPAIFNIDVVMEQDGDINHYDKEQTRVMSIRYLENNDDTSEYADLLDKNLTWLSRYAKPLPEEKKKSPLLLVAGLIFLIAGIFVGAIAPFSICDSIKKANEYKDYTHVEGVVISQENERLPDEKMIDGEYVYRINAIVQYSVDGKTYETSYTVEQKGYQLIDDEQDIIYKNDNPSKGLVAFYDVVSKTYLPYYGMSWLEVVVLVLLSVVVGIPAVLGGIYLSIMSFKKS